MILSCYKKRHHFSKAYYTAGTQREPVIKNMNLPLLIYEIFLIYSTSSRLKNGTLHPIGKHLPVKSLNEYL